MTKKVPHIIEDKSLLERLVYYFSLFAPQKAKRVPRKSEFIYSSPFYINGIKD